MIQTKNISSTCEKHHPEQSVKIDRAAIEHCYLSICLYIYIERERERERERDFVSKVVTLRT